MAGSAKCGERMGAQITEIAFILSTEKFYSTVAKMQKKRMTTPNVWASFRPQNRQEVQIPAIFAVKSWEDQILGARRRCHRTTDKDHAIPAKQGFQPCFFLLSAWTAPFSEHAGRATSNTQTAFLHSCDALPHVTENAFPQKRRIAVRFTTGGTCLRQPACDAPAEECSTFLKHREMACRKQFARR